MNSAISPNKEAALVLVNRGFRIFPCNVNKTPMVQGSWEQAATNSLFQTEAKWNANPHALPGLPVGPHGLMVIDCDRKPNGADGVAAFHSLCSERGIDLSGALVVQTPSGGLHYYFTNTAGYGCSKGNLPPGIDVKGLGGYVIAPGATLPDGRCYNHVQGSWDDVRPLPEALATFLKPKESQDISASLNSEAVDTLASRVQQCDRDYAAAETIKKITELLDMKPGDGINEATNKATHYLAGYAGNGSIEAKTIAATMLGALIVNGYVAADGIKTAQATIESGINSGMLKPLPLKSGSIISKPAKQWPSPLNSDAYIGIAGEFIRLVAPQTEGDPSAFLIAFLTVIGSLMGRTSYIDVSATRHFPNLFFVIVAETSKGRKGTVMDEIKRFAKMIDFTIAARIRNGLSSGEGLIEAVRDERRDEVKPNKQNSVPLGEVVDKGVPDKRLLVIEGEMGGALQAAGRDGNTLSATLRLAWDGETLQTLARNNKNVCREPHVSIIGNITLDELQRLLTSTDRNNGFANRFLWVCAKRSQLLPFGGQVDEAALQSLAAKASHCIEMASNYGKCGWFPDAASMWAKEYARLSNGKPGLVGAMSSRAEAQALRLALIYAILDGSNNIDVPHIKAAMEVWRYCQDSVEYCFGGKSNDSTADAIFGLLTSMPEGASLTQISALFKRNKSSEEIRRALAALMGMDKARSEQRKTNGRASEFWFAI